MNFPGSFPPIQAAASVIQGHEAAYCLASQFRLCGGALVPGTQPPCFLVRPTPPPPLPPLSLWMEFLLSILEETEFQRLSRASLLNNDFKKNQVRNKGTGSRD